MQYDTKILHTGSETDDATGALSVPIYNASTYHQGNLDARQPWEYSRSGNPTRAALEHALAELESGTHAFAFSSGMAAISSAMMALLKSGDHVVVTRDIYGGSYRLFTQFLINFGVTHTFVDATSLEQIEQAITSSTKAIYIESPTNPLLKIIDVAGVAEIAHRRSLISIIDNTFMSPYFMRPLELGIDVSIHSATKFLGGHSDLVAGAVIVRNETLAKQTGFVQNTLGAILSPNDSWLLMRGIKTLGARMKQQEQSAIKIASWLKEQPWVSEVLYPGIETHPGHKIISAQSSGFGAVISFKTDSVARAREIMQRAKLWAVAVSLGGVDAIMSYPWIMSHGSVPAGEKESLGITQTLIRLSVGLENPDDLINDIKG